MVVRDAHLSPEHRRRAVARLDAALPSASSAQSQGKRVLRLC